MTVPARAAAPAELRVLMLEDSPDDAMLIERALRAGGITPETTRVDTREAFTAALKSERPEVILADYSLPGFSGMDALRLVLELRPDTPLIVVTGTLNDEAAVELLHEGAHDYMLKDRLSRLPAAVRRAIERARAEEALRENEQRLLLATRASNVGLWDWNISENRVWFSPEWKRQLGYRDDELVSRYEEWESRLHPQDKAEVLERLQASLIEPWPKYQVEFRLRHRDGSYRWIYVDAELYRDQQGKPVRMLGCHLDITERKRAEQALKTSELRKRAIIETALDCIITIDGDGKIIEFNPAAENTFGYSRSEALGRELSELIIPSSQREAHKRGMQHFHATGKGPILGRRIEVAAVRKDGSEFPVELTVVPIFLPDGTLFSSHIRDITESKRAEHKIARLTRIYKVLSGINSAIVRIRNRQELFKETCRIAVEYGRFSAGWISSLDRATGKLLQVAQVGLPIDFSADEDSSEPTPGMIPAGVSELALRDRRAAFDNDIEQSPDVTIVRKVAMRAGAKSVIALPLIVEGVPVGILALYAPERNFFDDEEIKLLSELAGDISFGLEFIAKDEKVDYLAYYDTLTGLPNRTLFFDRLAHQLGAAERNGSHVALIVLDIDRFRLVNDTLGRQAGDALISAVAQRFKNTFRDEDNVARIGADSFAVATSGNLRGADAGRLLEPHNRRLFGEPFVLGKEELQVSATAGVALYPADGESPETLFANAEAALKTAKSNGERMLFYSPEMNARVADSLRLETRLRRALDNGEMTLWYQPKVSVSTRKLAGVEALMRWRDPESTLMVPPATFIPLMEQTGLILKAGTWAMSQIARDCKFWADAGFKPPRVAVNVSPIQLRQKDFVAIVAEAAQKTAETGGRLDLEITESVIMENVEAIIPALQTIRGLGLEIAIDDFGTGYSSLAYIAKLPIRALKIDRSFIADMTHNTESLTIVNSVVSLAHALKLQVVAEGVETEEQAAQLEKLGCDHMQGYLFSRPVPPEQVPVLLKPRLHA